MEVQRENNQRNDKSQGLTMIAMVFAEAIAPAFCSFQKCPTNVEPTTNGNVAFVTVPGVLHKYAPVKNQNGGKIRKKITFFTTFFEQTI